MMNGEKMVADRRPEGGAMSDQATNVIPFPRPHGGGEACGVGLTAGRFLTVP
jgi:hypothetical protein